MAKTKKMDLPGKQSYLFRGRYYGPGKGVEVPEDFPAPSEKRRPSLRASSAPQDPPDSAAAEVGGAGGEDTPPKAYSEMEKDELLELAEKRQLEVKGTGSNGNILKDDLVKALEESDKK